MQRILAILSCLLILLFLFTSCTSKQDSTPIDAYEFPVKPGTEEWKMLGGHDEMISVCQIPQETLTQMSTGGLIETCLNYPLLLDIFAHNFPQDGFNQVSSRFNGLSELLRHSGSGVAMLSYYNKFDLNNIKAGEANKLPGKSIFGIMAVETIFSQNQILSQLDINQLKELLSAAVNNMQAMKDDSETFGSLGIQYSGWLMGRTLIQANDSTFIQAVADDPILKNSLKTGFMNSASVDKIILPEAIRFLASK